jgi:acyl-coenzyme A synthetase/AMP-(fatty) acid ligase
MFLNDTPADPAAFFGAVRAGFAPLLINTLTPPDLLQFYLSDAGASVAVADAEFGSRFDAMACKDTSVRTLIVVNGAPGAQAVFAAELRDRRMTLKAVIVMNSPAFDATEATKKLQDYVKIKLLPYKYPREIVFIDELPKTGTGKIDRQALLRV